MYLWDAEWRLVIGTNLSGFGSSAALTFLVEADGGTPSSPLRFGGVRALYTNQSAPFLLSHFPTWAKSSSFDGQERSRPQ